ncbi:hypothetical protein [Agromyces larvae]|uniref:Uncharacterized protein n=1 Tax=Agromyces larvae TaxID=2929802 RepID=A0ABY4C1D9_9MICO|nr:hypothetical protein [Agromyces larvae]UOE43951.1 hypothetical protein MTO99_17600 [Agromyces larvae]
MNGDELTSSEFESLLAELAEATAEIERETRAQRDAFRAQRDADRERDDAAAAARRNGEHGRDWQVLQQRIDLSRTTLADIVNGVDDSDEARQVRRVMQRGLPEARQQFADLAADEQQADAVRGIGEAQAELARTIDRARAISLDFAGGLGIPRA